METRNITVVSTRDQKKSVISTNATTLGELKAALDAAGVDYAGMVFYEGLTHTELLADDSILPHDVEYKGTTTNELVFMLTNPDKKIRSGALPQARAALYSTIAEKSLEATCVAKYGKNMTNCSNAELLSVIEEAETAEAPVEATACVCTRAEAAIRALIDVLYDGDYLSDSEANRVRAVLTAGEGPQSPYSAEEIDDMFGFLNRE